MHGNRLRENERRRHLEDLQRSRRAALRRLRLRWGARYAGVLALATGLGLYLVASGSGVASPDDAGPTPGSRHSPLDELWVHGAIHLLDESGQQIALLGQEQRIGPIVLGLYAPTAPGQESEQTLRLATSESGSALSVRTATGDSSVTIFAGERGPEVELKQGSVGRLITHLSEPLRHATSSVARGLPAVGSGSPSSPEIDLSLDGIQDIGGGFMVSRLAAEERPDGVKVTGRVINTTSIKHRQLRFRMTLGERSEVFEINLISPGNSTGFAVLLPDAQLAGSGFARIEYLNSTVTYFGHSLRGLDGQLGSKR